MEIQLPAGRNTINSPLLCNILPCILFNVFFYFKLNTVLLFVHCYVSLQSVKLLINEHDDDDDDERVKLRTSNFVCTFIGSIGTKAH